MCEDGESLLEVMPQSSWVAKAVTIGPDGTAHTDIELLLDASIQDGTPAQRAWVQERFRPYPPDALNEPGRLTAFKALGIPTGYITATEDRSVEPHMARLFADRLPDPLRIDIPGGHKCMLTEPEAVTAALVAMGAPA